MAEVTQCHPVPAGLGASGTGLWTDVTSKYALRPDELRVLHRAARELDIIDQLEAALEGAPTKVQGAYNQVVANPDLVELRQHTALLDRLLARLKLPDETGAAAPPARNSPPGYWDRSEASRKAANERWKRAGVQGEA